MGKEPLRHGHSMPYGAEISNGVRFQLWAPLAELVHLVLEGVSEPIKMVGRSGDWFETRVVDTEPGDRYEFLLTDGKRCPDPASRFQPDGPHGMSEVIDSRSYAWRNGRWRGLPWHQAVIYEMHIGTFTQKGTFGAALSKLDHLADLGVTAVEIMPISDFPGLYGWGYDGVLPFAPAHVYGRPEEFKAFIDARPLDHGHSYVVYSSHCREPPQPIGLPKTGRRRKSSIYGAMERRSAQHATLRGDRRV